MIMIRWGALIVILWTISPLVICEDPPGHVSKVAINIPGSLQQALAIQEIIVGTLVEAKIPAQPARPWYTECAPVESFKCHRRMRGLLVNEEGSVGVMTVAAEELIDWHPALASIEELNEIAPPMRRACVATHVGPVRSVIDLADAKVAAAYDLFNEITAGEVIRSSCPHSNCSFTPEWCTGVPCATLLTSDSSEAEIFTSVVKENRLYATVTFLGSHLENITLQLSNYSVIACDFAPEITLAAVNYTTLSPPPCITDYCPFESRKLIKYYNKKAISSTVSDALWKLNFSKKDLRQILLKVQKEGYEAAAEYYFDNLRESPSQSDIHYVYVSTLLPTTTKRELYESLSLRVSVVSAELDVKEEWYEANSSDIFKVSSNDDDCQLTTAYKALDVAKSTTEYNYLSAVIGPTCGGSWGDLARKTSFHHIPIIAFTPQAPISGSNINDTQIQILAAGDAREWVSALLALMREYNWRRIGALYEEGTHPLMMSVRDYAESVVAAELPENEQFDAKKIFNWASRASQANTRIMFLCVEDVRVIRTALCAAHREALTPESGVVWLLCRTPPDNWTQPGQDETCTKQELETVAAGYFTLKSDWELKWEEELAKRNSIKTEPLKKRWSSICEFNPAIKDDEKEPCKSTKPSAYSALLYDVILMWGRNLEKTLKDEEQFHKLHEPDFVRHFTKKVTRNGYNGLTGNFNWNIIDGGTPARRISLVLFQWDPETGNRAIGKWNGQNLTLENVSLRWYTSDGRIPEDGSEHCTIQKFADALNSDCRTAYIALSTILVLILLMILGAIAYICKKRADQQYKERLAALGMRPLAIKPNGLDRWEIPRERVVINRKLGTGAFGTVYGGHALLAEDRGWNAVAVKTLKAGATTEEKLDFLSEAEAMKRFDHKNVVRLLGVVTKTEPVCTVMEFMLYGDLKNYLLARRHLAMGCGTDDEAGGEADEASPKRLTGMALDVARALSYLAQLRYVHRDVAARNCLVSARRVVKLADFGMTRLVFENDYYRFSRKGMLPVRWMAPESLALGVFSPASDVWSFGVLLYEIVTFGSLPFQGLSNSEVLSKVKGGHTLELPPGLKPQLEGLIKSCWQHDSKCRPTASEVVAFLADYPRLLSPCLDVPLDALPLDADPPWRLPREQAEARWVSWGAPASTATDTTYLSTDGANPLETDSFLA